MARSSPPTPSWRPKPRGVQSKGNPSSSGAYVERMGKGDPKGMDVRGKPPKDGVMPTGIGRKEPPRNGF